MNEKKKEIETILNKAESKLKTAIIDFESGQYDDSVSRSYYAVFHSISAALLTKNLAFSSHSQTIGAFNKEFIKTGIFPKEFSSIIQDLFEDRQTGDYDVITYIDAETAQQSIEKAKDILLEVRKYIGRL